MSLTIIREEARKALYERRRLKEHLPTFIKKAFETLEPRAVYEHNWHIDYVSEYLEAVQLGQIQHIIFNIAPRHLKSIVFSIAFPAFLLGRNPGETILAASFKQNLAMDLSTKCRTIMESSWYMSTFPGTRFAADQNEKAKYRTTKGGHRAAFSVGTKPMGQGGNYLICDDPIDPDNALSDRQRKKNNDWYTQSWLTRGNGTNFADIVVMQRVHVNDTTGHILELFDNYEHVSIPTEAETKTIVVFPLSRKKLIREQGNILQPSRISAKTLAAMKRKLPYVYNGQYQQRPVPAGGGLIPIDKFKRHKEEPHTYEDVIISYDTAQGDKTINNPSAGLVFGLYEGVWYLVHIWKDQVRYPALKQKVKDMAREFAPDTILIENKSSGISLIQDLEDDTTISLPIVRIQPEAEKAVRMNSQVSSIEAGLISLPDPRYINMEGLADFETNLMHFPSPKAWDEIDCFSQFLKYLRKRDMHKTPALPESLTKRSYWRGQGVY